MKIVSLGWTAQFEVAAVLANCRPSLDELFPGRNLRVTQQIAELCAALRHPETEEAVLIVGTSAEVNAAVRPIRQQLAEVQEPAGGNAP